MSNHISNTTDEVLNLLPQTLNSAFCNLSKWLINGKESLKLTAEAIREKVKQIPEDKLVEPEPYVAIPAIQQAICSRAVRLLLPYLCSCISTPYIILGRIPLQSPLSPHRNECQKGTIV